MNELETEADLLDVDPIVKRPSEPVASDELWDSLARSSSDPPPKKPLPEDPYPHADYPMVWCGVMWFKGPWELQCDGTWVQRRRVAPEKMNRSPGGHSEIWPQ